MPRGVFGFLGSALGGSGGFKSRYMSSSDSLRRKGGDLFSSFISKGSKPFGSSGGSGNFDGRSGSSSGLGGMFGGMMGGSGGLGGMLGGMMGGSGGLGGMLGGILGGSGGLGGMLGGMMGGSGGLGGMFGGMMGGSGGLGGMLGGMFGSPGSSGGFSGMVGQIAGNLGGVTKTIGGVAKTVGGVAGALGLSKGAFGTLGKAAGLIGQLAGPGKGKSKGEKPVELQAGEIVGTEQAAEETAETPEATAEITPEATSEATAQSTPEATEEATAESTPEATEEATAESTPEATEEATAESTPEASTQSTLGATSGSSSEQTQASQIPAGGGGTVATTGAIEGTTKSFGGQSVQEEEEILTKNFLREARISLKKDGIEFSSEHELDSMLVELSNQSKLLADYLAELRKDEPDPSKLPEDIGAFVADISDKVQNAVKLTTRKKHPSLNVTLLKFEAVAYQMQALSAPKGEMPDIVQSEVSRPGAESEVREQQDEANDTSRAEAEVSGKQTSQTETTEKNEGVSNKDLFNTDTMLTGTKQAIGATFMKNVGIGDLVRKSEFDRSETTQERLTNMKKATDAIAGKGAKVTEFAQQVLKNRPELTGDQASKYVTLCLLFGMGMERLAKVKAQTWGMDPGSEGYFNEVEMTRNSYFSIQRRGKRFVSKYRQQQLEEADRLEQLVSDAVSGIGGPGGRRAREAS